MKKFLKSSYEHLDRQSIGKRLEKIEEKILDLEFHIDFIS